MTYLLLHRDRDGPLLVDDPVIPREDVVSVSEGVALLSEIRRLDESLRAQRRRALEEAVAEGRARGYAEGAAEARREYAARCAELERLTSQYSERLRRQVVALSLQALRRIAGELGDGPVVAALAEKAVRDLVPDEPAVIHVHPAQADSVRSAIGRLAAVEADPALAPAGCVIRTAAGSIDAGLETQIAALESALLNAGRADG